MLREDRMEHMGQPKAGNVFDYAGSSDGASGVEALKRENEAERGEKLQMKRNSEMKTLQEDFDRDSEKIQRERALVRRTSERKDLQEKVERLKMEYHESMKQRNEYAEAERNRGFMKRMWEKLFVPRNASSPDRLNVIALDTRVRQSLAMYRAAKKELEDVERLISAEKPEPQMKGS